MDQDREKLVEISLMTIELRTLIAQCRQQSQDVIGALEDVREQVEELRVALRRTACQRTE